VNVFKKATALVVLTSVLTVGANSTFKYDVGITSLAPTVSIGQPAKAWTPASAMFASLSYSARIAYIEYKTFGMNNNDMARVLGWRGNHRQMANACAERFNLNYRYSNVWGTDAYFIKK
jgi:hypothetical protein